MPVCPRPGHDGSKVVRAGLYGKPPRQLFRCLGTPEGTHRFAGTLPRLVTEPAVCLRCDNHVGAHQGPVLSSKYEFHLRLAAAALADVGRGRTYTEAATRARIAAGRGPYTVATISGALVAEWLDVFAPVLVAAHAETAWPATLLADSTNFFITNSWTGQRDEGFNVFGLYG